MDYEAMLKKGRSELPESAFFAERFEIPKVRGHLEGNKTVISNFSQVADTLQRPVNHFLKYLLRELATPGVMRGGLLVLGTKVPASRINEKVRKYATEFVLCSECGKPDTKIMKEGQLSFLKCMACGAKNSIKTIDYRS